MGAAAIVGMGLSAIGVILVWTTFREAKRAADAGFEANRLAEISSRPWLTLEMEHGHCSAHTDSDEILFFANLKISNIGGSPAQNVTVDNADIPDVIRNEFNDLFIISENLSDQFSELEHLVVFPTTTETHQTIFAVRFTKTGAGHVAFPDILIVVNYRLGNGVPAQTTARFMGEHGVGSRELFRGQRVPSDFRFKRTGYIRVT